MTTPLLFACLAFMLLVMAADAQETFLLQESFEDPAGPRVQLHGANQPYEQHALEISNFRAHSGEYSLKVDYTYKHGLQVYLAPRSNAIPQVEWGGLGGAGSFNLPGLGIPLRPDRGYVLSVWVWVEEAGQHNPLQIEVETATTSDYGLIRTQTCLDQVIAAATGGWVQIEQELTGTLIAQMDAAGAKTEDLHLNAISLNTFANGQYRLTAYVDDLTLREVPLSTILEYKQAQVAAAGAKPTFRSYPAVENTFIWGVYGGLAEPGPEWLKPFDRTGDVRARQAEEARQFSDWTLLDLRRHYCNTLIQGGGMLFAPEGQSAYDYVTTCLDKCDEYGLKFAPSTYLTQHYIPDASREQCEAAMRQAVETFGKHPALLAYWLVDEPGAATAEDFYWGKRTLEALDSEHPALCTCNSINSIRTFADRLPILCLDYYPIGPIPSGDKGAWAVGDSARYARYLGAHRTWMLPQVFGQSSWRAPSREEFLIQIFSSLAEGATGFAPYAYADRPQWHDAHNEYGRLVDPYGNPSPAWEEMRRLGPLLRSAGGLLTGAERLPEEAVTAQIKTTVVSPVGRSRPAAVARAFHDAQRNLRYVVAYNNSPAYRWTFPVALRELAAGEQVLDLFSLSNTPLTNNVFMVYLPPGDGRLYAVGQPEVLAAAATEVRANRLALERDLLELEIHVARRMGTDTVPVEVALAAATTLEEVLAAHLLLDRQQRADRAFWPIHITLETCRASLGRTNALMSRRLGRGGEFSHEAPEIIALCAQMVSLSERFYVLQAQLLQRGPADLTSEAQRLWDDVEAQAAKALVLLGG